MKTVLFFSLTAVLLLSGCSDESQSHTSALSPVAQDEDSNYPGETQLGFRGKARSVEGVLQGAAEERQAAIEEME